MTAPAVVATTEAVAVAWLKAVVGNVVATSLPDGPGWSESGFVTVSPVGGATSADVPMRRPVVSVDVWANNPDSNKTPWGKANALAEAVYAACYDNARAQVKLTVAGHQVQVFSVSPNTEPIRVPGDPSGYAHYVFNLELPWVAV